MNLTKLCTFPALALVASLALGLEPSPLAPTEVGSTVSYEFRSPVVNGMGLRSLDDLRGKPVLVEFWGTR